ncbi:MAG: SPOR domain-containing protein [Candidatus Omnitrophica bacterium]|jgi:tetratricopeptide (TPR) repeat protein|nr:SPOR domain-containing protein [Candidatus Omnitrophota bacterium]
MRLFLLIFIFLSCVINVWPDALDSAYEEYLAGSYDEARDIASRMPDSKEKLYFMGLVNIKLGNYSVAREHLRRYLQRYPESEDYETALIKLGDTYFLEGDLQRADNIFREIEEKYPNVDRLPVVYLRLAQISAKEGRWADKRAYLRIIDSDFRDAPEIEFADILKEQGDYFTVQVGAFGSKDNAYALDNELKKLGYSSYVDVTYKKDYTLYKVKVGKFYGRLDAESVYDKLIRQGYSAKIYP